MRTYAEVIEGVRATIAAYAQALDDGRTDDVVATFCPDGVCDIPGMGTHAGHDALRDAYCKWKPRRPQRHLVVNTLVTDWDDHEANAISDVVFILQGDSVGRSSSWADTTTPSTTTTARGGSTVVRPSS
jgi:SnoaL-like domain